LEQVFAIPEEINRVLTSKLADIHFAPTTLAKENLIKDGIDNKKNFITGNTVIDTLLKAKIIAKESNIKINGLPSKIFYDCNKEVVLITGHRRENFGKGFENICNAIAQLATKFDKIYFVYPVHLNPNVRRPVYEILANIVGIFLIEPLEYLPFIALMNKAKIILTDSGCIQEEAPSLGKLYW